MKQEFGYFLKNAKFRAALGLTLLLSYGYAIATTRVSIDSLEGDRYIGTGGVMLSTGRFGMNLWAAVLGWQRQLHIYECPFYYIDYCLSTMAALQFFLLSLDDHKDAWERYLKLVRRAGLASYTELLQTAGLKVPFEEGSVKGIAQQMTRWLEEHQVD